ncbi:MAG TPA: bifunctional nuclease domain-containing protein [Anaeromyxobacter sp.]
MAHAGLLALPAAAMAGIVALATVPAAAPGEAGVGGAGRVELEVAGILPMPEGSSAIVVLREKGARTLLPLIVPRGMADARPEARGSLLGQAIEALGGRVAEVEIDRAEETRAGARVRLAQGAKRVELRARPSESVALAMAAKVPIVTTRRVLEQAGLSPEDLARAHAKVKAGESKL